MYKYQKISLLETTWVVGIVVTVFGLLMQREVRGRCTSHPAESVWNEPSVHSTAGGLAGKILMHKIRMHIWRNKTKWKLLDQMIYLYVARKREDHWVVRLDHPVASFEHIIDCQVK